MEDINNVSGHSDEIEDLFRMDSKKRLIKSILQFLKSEYRSGELNPEKEEGIEVAIQCLESAYEVQESVQSEPTLLEIYKAFKLPVILQSPDASEEDKQKAESLKCEGNSAMSQGQYPNAVKLYSRAIKLDPKNAVYYCNRAAAHSRLQDHISAVVDCKTAIGIDPHYSKAYGRLGLAYCGLEEYKNAAFNYKKATELDPTNEGYKKNYELALSKVNAPFENPPVSRSDETESESSESFDNLFNNPQLVNLAMQVMRDPPMQTLMNNLISSGMNPDVPAGPQGLEQICSVGRMLAEHLRSQHPNFYTNIRTTVNPETTHQETNQQQNQSDPSQESERPKEKTPEGSKDISDRGNDEGGK